MAPACISSTGGSSNLVVLLIVTTLFGRSLALVTSELGSVCETRAGDRGRCVEAERCRELLTLSSNPSGRDGAPGTSRGTMCSDTLVCCTKHITLPEPPQCGTQNAIRKIEGTQAYIDEFPWMALIEYTHYSGSTLYYCDGVLIDARNILTAAHCLHSVPKTLKLQRVRLGEWNVSSPNDCEHGFCSDAPIDLEIGKIIVHPDYQPGDWNHAHDIALVRFTRNVPYSDTIRPICLPTVETPSDGGVRSPLVIVAGWEEEVKGWAYSTIRPQEECASVYRVQQLLHMQPGQLCVGNRFESNNCRYTAGSPAVQKVNGSWYVRGIGCVQPSSCAPSVGNLYTDVVQYVDWIRDNVY